jgi:DUF4097 and DUF4098 domain-containing protein YvlB
MRLSRQAAFLLTCAFLLTFQGCVFAYPAVEGKFERTLSVGGPVVLEVTNGSGKIKVRAGSSSSVQIYGLIQARDDWRNNAREKVNYLTSNPPIEQSGNVIKIGRISDEAYRNNVSISYEITVPAETRIRSKTGSGSQSVDGVRGPVDASTGSGSITMYHIGGDVLARTGSGRIVMDDVSGRLDAGTGSGSIRAEHIAGSIKASTGSGSVTLGQVSAEQGGSRDVEVHTGSGSIEVSGVNGSLRAVSGSGGIRASGIPAGDWSVEASSGSVTLHVGANAAFELNAHASSGRITVDHPITVTGTASKRDMRGTVLGGGRLIQVRTGSGSITIQ